jgi:hypothetical protein
MWCSDIASHSVVIKWKLNCGDEPIVVGYNISYCQLSETDPDECNDEMKSVILILQKDDELYQFKLMNLKAYRVYRIHIALMSQTRLGPSSFPLVVQTLESGKIRFHFKKWLVNIF